MTGRFAPAPAAFSLLEKDDIVFRPGLDVSVFGVQAARKSITNVSEMGDFA
jgi:hypothetical protein